MKFSISNGTNTTTSNNTTPINTGSLSINGNNFQSTYTNGYVDYQYNNTIQNVDSIALIDEKDGTHWKLKISDGELVIEPLDKVNIRKLKIKKVLDSE